jgi:hypothetical protein
VLQGMQISGGNQVLLDNCVRCDADASLILTRPWR